jgi:hypothetical protein
MKRIKIVFATTLAALTLGAAQVSAQDKPVTFGVKAGVNLSTLGGDMKDSRYTFRYQAGITADIALTENLYILTGLDLQAKGTKMAGVKYNPIYLQLPATIGYKFDLGSNTRLVLNAGPYIAYGIGGKAKGGEAGSRKLFKDDIFKRLDYGVIGGVGVEVGMFSVGAGYDLGLGNISDAKGIEARNRNAYLTVGVKF